MLSLLRHFFNETKQICASHTKRGGAMGFKFEIKSTYKTKSQQRRIKNNVKSHLIRFNST